MIILQHNVIKSSFEKSLDVVSHVFNVTRYKKLVGFVTKYVLQYIAKKSDRVEYVGLDKSRCGCTIRYTHDLPCACELASFGVGSIPLQSMHFIWIRLSFLDISSGDTSAELSIQQEWIFIMNRFNEVDMASNIKHQAKIREIVSYSII